MKKLRVVVFVAFVYIFIVAFSASAETGDWCIPWHSSVILSIGPLNPNSSAYHATWQGNGYAIDFLGNSNVKIYAPADGTIICAEGHYSEGTSGCKGGHGGYGNHIIIRTTDGEEIILAHFSSLEKAFSAGERVSKGQPLATMGSSGNSTADHLHFEIKGRKGQNITLFGRPTSFFTTGVTLSGGVNDSGNAPDDPVPPTPDPTPTPQAGTAVVLHDNNGGSGENISLEGLPLLIDDLDTIGWGNKASSITVPDGIKVKIYQRKQCKGHNMEYESGLHDLPSDLSDNLLKSLKAWPAGSQEPPDPPNPPNPGENPIDHDHNTDFPQYRYGENTDTTPGAGVPNVPNNGSNDPHEKDSQLEDPNFTGTGRLDVVHSVQGGCDVVNFRGLMGIALAALASLAKRRKP
jgi:murein DD-endopeptidase MepM/ murein hydrolase activator NlpD